MLDLIRVVQPKVADTGELVAVVRQLVAGGTVDLCGSFRGERLLRAARPATRSVKSLRAAAA